ncbi:GNAT family N-acetyltransferase [Aeromicrobium endophyticum]|uniref:GNAT family N-acetyltransferase n=2 Tax=Aeromicrobium endophyticum TaxID=2292704 RepID=A0A371PEY8_9ACTN|nr:GNAT family N-acetyltransferase [Aeromicrobium endophyticum]
MHSHTPAESVHALDVDSLRGDGVTFWSAWSGDALAGCGALQQIDPAHGEIKSMRTADAFRGQGVASLVLVHLLDAARSRGYRRVSLETGSNSPFAPARRLYERHGFTYGEPFADYEPDPWSVFMSLDLA